MKTLIVLLTSEDEHVDTEVIGSEDMSSEPVPVISADVEVQEETTKDGTKWILIEETGRRSIQNVLTEQPGLTHYAKRMIDSPLSAFQNNWLIRRCSVISRSVQKQKLEMF